MRRECQQSVLQRWVEGEKACVLCARVSYVCPALEQVGPLLYWLGPLPYCYGLEVLGAALFLPPH